MRVSAEAEYVATYEDRYIYFTADCSDEDAQWDLEMVLKGLTARGYKVTIKQETETVYGPAEDDDV